MSAPIIKRVVAIDIGGTKIASALVTIGVGDKPFVEHYAKIPTEAKAGGRRVLANAIASAERVIALAGGVDGLCGIGVSSGAPCVSRSPIAGYRSSQTKR